MKRTEPDAMLSLEDAVAGAWTNFDARNPTDAISGPGPRSRSRQLDTRNRGDYSCRVYYSLLLLPVPRADLSIGHEAPDRLFLTAVR